MHERLAARRKTVMTARRESLLASLEDLAGQLEFLGSRLDVEMLRNAAVVYREAREAIMTARPNEEHLLRLFRALNASTAEIGELMQRYSAAIDPRDRPTVPHPDPALADFVE